MTSDHNSRHPFIKQFSRAHPYRALLALVLWLIGMPAWVSGVDPSAGAVPVSVPARKLPADQSPHELILTVQETAGIARNAEVIRQGVPLPRSLNLRDMANLVVVDANQKAVPAEFQVLARWNAGRNETSMPIQWLLISFPAQVAAHGSAIYRLVWDGSAGPNPQPETALHIFENNNQITVTTGAASFTLGGNPAALFDAIQLNEETRLVSGSLMTATLQGQVVGHSTLRKVHIEHVGALTAIISIDGAYDLPAFGGGGIASQRRYIFTAGSPTALVRQVVAWEGNLCAANGGGLTCDVNGDGVQEVNGVRVSRIQDAFTLNLSAPLTVSAIGPLTATLFQAPISNGQSAWVRQQLRPRRTAELAFEVQLPGQVSRGERADGAMLMISGTDGSVAVALQHMDRYAPQALRRLADGRLAIEIADDLTWLGQRQGLFANLAVSALPTAVSRARLNEQLWAPLNHPLHAWPSANWFAASQAVDELPAGPLPAAWSDLDNLLSQTISTTLQKIDLNGLSGLMTSGLYPRYWGDIQFGNELDCTGNDPTPDEAWDDFYWCATWTDYHNTAATSVIWAMRSGAIQWLDELAFPAAQRMLFTQIMQCTPDDTWFYCGQSPAGYGGYRSDFNSSHAYFENLFLYYWLTGDETVVRTLERGTSTMRTYLCFRRPAQPCLPDDPPTNPWSAPTGRAAAQWQATFRFVGLAGEDASYLEDFRSGLARAVTQYYVEASQHGISYGFWLACPADPNAPCAQTRSTLPSTDQLWMASLYDMENLFHLQRDTQDAPLGNPAIRPSRILAAWARSLQHFGPTVMGEGSAQGTWPNALYISWNGPRLGGTLTSVSANTSYGDPVLWDTGKATLTATLLRAAEDDPDLRQMGADLTRLAIDAARADASPLGKVMGLYLARLPAAVAHLTGPASTRPIYLPLVNRDRP